MTLLVFGVCVCVLHAEEIMRAEGGHTGEMRTGVGGLNCYL